VLIYLLKGFAAKQVKERKKERKKTKKENVFLALLDYSLTSQQFGFPGR
jgi:hypothetical protein